MITTREAAKHVGLDIKQATVAVQGFGNVGSVSADLISHLGAKIVAVTDWKGGVYNPSGLDVPALIAWTKQHKTVAGFSKAETLAADKIFEMDVDILVPAALENQITIANAKKPRSSPRAPTATTRCQQTPQERACWDPQILANAGGVPRASPEGQDQYGLFLGRGRSEHAPREEDERAFHNVPSTSISAARLDRRPSAAIERLSMVTKPRGIYPSHSPLLADRGIMPAAMSTRPRRASGPSTPACPSR
jgi:glutamate dehydrogenase/leucine dehydrogenase